MSEETTTEPRDFNAEVEARDEALSEGFLPEPKPEPEVSEETLSPAEVEEIRVSAERDVAGWRKEKETAELRDDLLGLAITAYEDGTIEPAEIADFLAKTSPELAGQFTNYWYNREEAQEAEDVLPSEWAFSRRAQIESKAQTEHQVELDKQTEKALAEAHKKLHSRYPAEYSRLAATMDRLGAKMLVHDPSEAEAKTYQLFQLALKASSAEAKAALQVENELDTLASLDPSDPFWKTTLGVNAIDPDELFKQRLYENLQREAVGVLSSSEQTEIPDMEAELDEDLFGKQRVMEAGWDFGKSDIGARQLEEWAKKKSLSPLSPEAQQYGRKKGWIR